MCTRTTSIMLTREATAEYAASACRRSNIAGSGHGSIACSHRICGQKSASL